MKNWLALGLIAVCLAGGMLGGIFATLANGSILP
jgi:uncharacterized protein YneF (UPF0154 family)